MDNIKNIIISFWYDEMTSHPKDKVNDLQEEVKSIIDTPLLFNSEEVGHLISIPRIQGMSKDHQYLLQVSLINTNLSISKNDLDIDDAILLINIQYLYDAIKNTFDVRICYTSIKVELIEKREHASKHLKEIFDIKDDLEDFSIRRGFIKDDYYINYLLNSGKEFNFNIEKKPLFTEQDIFDKTLVTSLKDANSGEDFIVKVIEINDRCSFNNNPLYTSTKDNIRGMIIELKNILNNKLYEKK